MSRDGLRSLLRDGFRFGTVGIVGVFVDVGLFNVLLAATHGRVPLIAKTISMLAAIAMNWIGNRWWAFRDRRGAHAGPEALAFLAISLAGSAISLGCLALTHYVFGLTSPLADNISANVIGLGLGSVFRFVAVRVWLFRPGTQADAPPRRLLSVP